MANSTQYTIVLSSDVSKFLEGFNQAGQRISGFINQLAAAFGVGFGINELVRFTKQAIDSAEAMGRLSKETTFTVQALEAIRKQALELGVPFEEFQSSMALFVAKMEEARTKGGAAMDVFRNIGQDVAVAVAQGRPAEEVYGMIAQKFKEGAVSGREAAVAHELFGKAFRQWVPILQEGIDGLDKMKVQGGGITPEMVEQATKFNQSWRELKDQLDEVFRVFATNILPMLQQFVQWLRNLNTEESGVVSASEYLTTAFKVLATVLVALKTSVLVLGAAIGDYLAYAFETVKDEIQVAIRLFTDWWNMIKNVTAALLDMGKAALDAGKLVKDIVTGNFSQLADDGKEMAERFKKDLVSIGSSYAGAWKSTFAEVEGLAVRQFDRMKVIWNQFSKTAFSESLFSANTLDAIWGTPENRPKPVGAGNSVAGSGTGTGNAGGTATDKLSAEEKELQFLREKIQLEEKVVQSDTTQDQISKARILIPLLNQEVEAVQKQIALQAGVANDPTRTETEKVKAKQEIVKLLDQQLALENKIGTLEDSMSFTGRMKDGLAQLSSAWGNLSHNVADVALGGIQTAVSGVSEAIMGAIDGTKTWGQVFAQVGKSIIASIIQMVVQWIASMTIIAALKAAFGIKDTQEAATSASAWAPAAIAASIASYGTAAGVGAAAFAAAMFSGTALAAGLSATGGIAGRASGGPVSGNTPYIVGERGPELVIPGSNGFVIPADKTASILNGLKGLPGRVDWPTPITSENSSRGQAVRQGMAGGSGSGTPNVNVEGHKATFIFPQTRQEALNAMKSAEGKAIVLGHVKNNRVEVGMNT